MSQVGGTVDRVENDPQRCQAQVEGRNAEITEDHQVTKPLADDQQCVKAAQIELAGHDAERRARHGERSPLDGHVVEHANVDVRRPG